MSRASACAKINLALVVGERRADGLHQLATVLQRIDIRDELELEEAAELGVEGYAEDTLVREALTRLAQAAGVAPRWRVRIDKAIPVAAGLGGGSADAGAALVLANRALPEPLAPERLAEVGAAVGADVPFFLEPGPKLAEGAGERLTPLDLPQDYWVVVALPAGTAKRSTAAVYQRFDELAGGAGFEERRRALVDRLSVSNEPRDLAALPPNDLGAAAGRPALVDHLLASGAFRADVSGAGPAVYALFADLEAAEAAALAIEGDAWVAKPVW